MLWVLQRSFQKSLTRFQAKKTTPWTGYPTKEGEKNGQSFLLEVKREKDEEGRIVGRTGGMGRRYGQIGGYDLPDFAHTRVNPLRL